MAQVPLPGQLARDETAAGYASLELRTERSSYFVQEPISVQLRFGFDALNLQDKLVPIFRQPMDLPFQLQAPWLAQLPGALALGEAPLAATDSFKSFVLNDALARARSVEDSRVDGRHFRMFEIERKFLATSAGRLELPESRLRFAYAVLWNEGFATDRVAVDRVEAFVRGVSRTLSILPLPEEGRPENFCGAVGRLALRSELSANEVELGSSLKLALHITGEGNLETFELPRLERIEGWSVNGSTDHRTAEERTIEYDLAPQSALVTRLPQVSFAFFDTTPPASYRTLRTEPAAIMVRESAMQARAARPAATAPPERSRTWIAGLCIAIAVLIGLGVRARRSRSVLGQ